MFKGYAVQDTSFAKGTNGKNMNFLLNIIQIITICYTRCFIYAIYWCQAIISIRSP